MKLRVTWSTYVKETYSAAIELPEDIAAKVAAARTADPDLTLSEALGQVEVDSDYTFAVDDLLPEEEIDAHQTDVAITERDIAEIKQESGS